MSVLIRGMEMPTSCNACMFDVYGLCLINKNIEGKDELTHSCPLVQVPPHGDLIDRHEAYLRFGKLAETLEEKNDYLAGAPYAMAALFLNNVEEFPTIIPAEEGE